MKGEEGGERREGRGGRGEEGGERREGRREGRGEEGGERREETSVVYNELTWFKSMTLEYSGCIHITHVCTSVCVFMSCLSVLLTNALWPVLGEGLELCTN